jgi:hypothetical protein
MHMHAYTHRSVYRDTQETKNEGNYGKLTKMFDSSSSVCTSAKHVCACACVRVCVCVCHVVSMHIHVLTPPVGSASAKHMYVSMYVCVSL